VSLNFKLGLSYGTRWELAFDSGVRRTIDTVASMICSSAQNIEFWKIPLSTQANVGISCLRGRTVATLRNLLFRIARISCAFVKTALAETNDNCHSTSAWRNPSVPLVPTSIARYSLLMAVDPVVVVYPFFRVASLFPSHDNHATIHVRLSVVPRARPSWTNPSATSCRGPSKARTKSTAS